MVFQIPQHAIGDSLGYKFRGAWNAPEPIFVEDFSEGGPLPSWMSVRDNGSSTLSLSPMHTSRSEPKPDLPWVWRVSDVGTYTGIYRLGFQVDLDALSVIAGREGGLLEIQIASWLPSGSTPQIAELYLDNELRLSLNSGSVTIGPWHRFQIPLQGHSIADAVYNFSTGSTPLNVDLASVILYASTVNYEFGDIVAHDDDFWRCAKAGTLAEPGRSSHWQKIPSSIITKTLLLKDIRNVDLTGLYDKAVLTYHHEDQKWRPGDKTEDQRNFRGDWQDTSNTLLWSSDFTNPADLDLFIQEYVTLSGSVQTPSAAISSIGGPEPIPNYSRNLLLRLTTINTSSIRGYGQWTLNTEALGLQGCAFSRITYWERTMAPGAVGRTEVQVEVGGRPLVAPSHLQAGLNNTTSAPWVEREVVLGGTTDPPAWRLIDLLNDNWGVQISLYMAGLKIFGTNSVEDLFGLGDVVFHEGRYWRSLFNQNFDEPSEESVKWVQIGDIFAQKTYALSGLTDVDLSGKYGGAILKYDEEQQVWRPGSYAPDYRNFRGDWQDPADTLLWSSDFSNPADVNFFENYQPGTVVPTLSSRTALLDVAGKNDVGLNTSLRISVASTTEAGGTLPLANIGLGGNYISRIKYWEGDSFGNSTGGKTTRAVVDGTIVHTRYVAGTSSIGWSEVELTILSVMNNLQFRIYAPSGSPNIMEITGLRIYGATDSEDLYRLNDVVAHNGFFWRSLFNLNADEPSEASEKWEKISEFVVDGHVQPQGIGRVEDLPSSTSRSGGVWSKIYQEVTPKEDFWLDKVRFYTGGGGDCVVYVRDLQGNVLRTGTFNTGTATTTTPEWFGATLNAPLHLTAESSYLVGFEPATSVNTHRASGLYNGMMWRTRRALLNGFDWVGGANMYDETHGMGLVEFDSTA